MFMSISGACIYLKNSGGSCFRIGLNFKTMTNLRIKGCNPSKTQCDLILDSNGGVGVCFL
jgi:hypothetical protein